MIAEYRCTGKGFQRHFYFMIVFKYQNELGKYIEIHFCEAGLFIEIDEVDSGECSNQNIIIDKEFIEKLKEYLNG